MPMAGKGIRLQDFDPYPKPLVKVLGRTIVEWSIKTLGIEGNYIFCCKKEHIEKFKIDELLKLSPNSVFYGAAEYRNNTPIINNCNVFNIFKKSSFKIFATTPIGSLTASVKPLIGGL